MKPFTFKTILPATILALLPFGTQAGAAPFTFSTTAPDQARGGLENVDFKMRKAERNWWQPRNGRRVELQLVIQLEQQFVVQQL